MKPARYQDFVSFYSCLLAGPADDNEPSCFDEAHGKKDWEQACCSQFFTKYGENYEETFSPVEKLTSVCVVISLAVVEDGNYGSWMLKMLSYMERSIVRFIRCNHRIMYHKSIQNLYASLRRRSMA